MPHGDHITAPFNEKQIQCLNEFQTQTAPGFAMHPFTCQNRSDGFHGEEGGDLGVLIATASGWVCPHCSYTQDWAFTAMAERLPSSVIELYETLDADYLSKTKTRLENALAAYRLLAAQHHRGAGIMVGCLDNRSLEIKHR